MGAPASDGRSADERSPWQLAQFNVAHLHQPLDHPDTAAFVAGLGSVNDMAEASPGFVWRLTDDAGRSSSYVAAYDDPLVIINLSVWESPGALADFVFHSGHTAFLRRRREWFRRMDAPFFVCWWIDAGNFPSVAEAITRLDLLRDDGESDDAFTLRAARPPPVHS